MAKIDRKWPEKESVDFIRELCHPDQLHLRGGIAIKARLAAEEEANQNFHIRVRIKSTDHMSFKFPDQDDTETLLKDKDINRRM